RRLLAGLVSALVLSSAAMASNRLVTIAIDASKNRHAISPNIYGVAWASTADLKALNAPLNRMGGNAETTYNWAENAENRSADWYYESYPQESGRAGEEADTLIGNSKAAGADALLTMPLIGWVAKLGANRSILPSYSVSKY